MKRQEAQVGHNFRANVRKTKAQNELSLVNTNKFDFLDLPMSIVWCMVEM